MGAPVAPPVEEDETLTAGLDALRSKFSGSNRGVQAKPGGRLRKSASSAVVHASSAALERTAVESVHGGLIV